MASRRSTLQEDIHFRILRLLEANPDWTQRELAQALGISNGSAHYAIGALVSKGLVKFRNFRSAPNKRRYAYVLTPKGIAEKSALTRRFLARKIAEYESLKSEIETLTEDLASRRKTERPRGQ